jgi:hypothetical protein
MRPSRPLCSFLGIIALASAAEGAVEIKELPDKVTIDVGGKPFTEYHFTGAPHVYFYPLFGPGGAKMTRDWPMNDVPSEAHDHPHHRSFWFAHGMVNGADFWAEPASFPAGKPPKIPLGQIVHDKFLIVQGGEKEGVLQDQLKWVAPDGGIPLTSVQTFKVYEGPDTERVFDFEVVLKAGEKDVIFGDTKEGSMAMRINESMRLIQADKKPGAGHMVDSAGDTDGNVWGKRAEWVDYSGPVDGKTLGIAFFDHPSNPRHPTRWHARDYGLFAANPFCEHDMDKTQPAGAGDFKIPAGQSATFKYRFILHEGDATQAKTAERFAAYAAEK